MILIIDFGSQTAHLIGRRLRQLGIKAEYSLPDETIAKIAQLKPSGIILSGGPASVYDQDSPTIDKKVFTLGIPILAICYGCQLMAKLLGGEVKSGQKEYGLQKLNIHKPSSLFALPQQDFSVIMSHGDSIIDLPKGFEIYATTPSVPYAGIADETKKLYGVLFHPEAEHTELGIEIFKKFTQDICKEKIAPLKLYPQKIIENIKITVGNQKVIMAVSGGVDSTVAAFLIGRAIGDNLIPVYVDSGLMRPETDKRVKHIFTDLIKANLKVVQAEERFLKSLKGIIDPEIKRKTIGKLYIDIFNEVASEHQEATFLGQGTIYSDVIESKGSKHASHIKSHHNVGGLPQGLKFSLLEPLRTFYKDEVRELGRLAGLPEEIVKQQPWPGPGFAINIRGEVTEERLQQIKLADAIVVSEMKKAHLYDEVFECWAVMTGAYSTAVKGDGRAFAEVVGIRSIDSNDVMTATWTKIPYEVLAIISSRIVNEVPNISRVVYDITSKPPATMRWE